METPDRVYAPDRSPDTVYHGVATNFAPAPSLLVPNSNPAKEAVARMKVRATPFGEVSARQQVQRDYTGAKNPDLLIQRIVELEDALDSLKGRVCGILAALNNATIEAVCNEDSTITVTLTLPDLPAECP